MPDATAPPTQEKHVVLYKTTTGEEITLTVDIVRQFFLPDATPVEAHAFMGFCKFTGLNPFLREVYLSRMGGDDEDGGKGRASIVVAYTTFMKRAEQTRLYGGFKAGIVIIPEKDAARPGHHDPVSFDGEKVVGVYPPCVAIQGEMVPPGYALFGGWCLVWRTDRADPIPAVLPLSGYVRLRRIDGKPMRMWQPAKASMMIRKTAIGHSHRDAFTVELADFYLDSEYAPITTEPPERPSEADLMPKSKASVIVEEIVITEDAAAPSGGDVSGPAAAPTTISIERSGAAAGAKDADAILVALPPEMPEVRAAAVREAREEAHRGSEPQQLEVVINNRTFKTKGTTRAQLLDMFALEPKVEKIQKGLPKAILKKEFQVDHRTDLTADQGDQYLIRLEEILVEK